MTESIVPADIVARDVLVAVCTKCEGDGKALRRALKRAFKDRGFAKRARLVSTSCLDVCPKRAVAVAICDRRRGAGASLYAVAGKGDGVKAVVDLIIGEAGEQT